MYKRVSGGLPKFGRNQFTPGRSNTGGSQQSVYMKRREPINDVKGQRQDKSHYCENWFKPNHREDCPTRNIICNKSSGRGHFAKNCRKATGNQVDDSKFTQYENNVIQWWDTEKTEEFGVFAIRTVWDKSGRENRKLIDVQLGKKR